MSAALCGSCRRMHRRPSRLRFVGYRELGGGEVGELRACSCGLPVCVAIFSDASVCIGCRRLVRGDDPRDAKVIVEHCDGGVYCTACAATLLYAGEDIENGRAIRRILAAGGHIHRPSLQPMLRDEDPLENQAVAS